MIRAGIIVEAEPEATGWASLAFPRRKPNSSPIKCRWVTDFRDLNRALDRPVWGGESSGQLLRHLDPSAKFFAILDAVSGFHQMVVDPKMENLRAGMTQQLQVLTLILLMSW